MKKVVFGFLIIIGILVVAGIGFGIFLTGGLAEGKALQIEAVDLTGVSDGSYHGSYKAGRWSNEVDVTIKDHKISNIKLVKDVKIPMEGLQEQVAARVIDKQNVNIDVVSGATITTKAYLMSIRNAITDAK